MIFETQHPLLSKSQERFKKKVSPTAHKNLTTVSPSLCSTVFHYLRLYHPSCSLSPAPSTFLYHKLLLKVSTLLLPNISPSQPQNLHSQNQVFSNQVFYYLMSTHPKLRMKKWRRKGGCSFSYYFGGFPHVLYHTHLTVQEKSHSAAASLHSLSIFSVIEHHIEFSPGGS